MTRSEVHPASVCPSNPSQYTTRPPVNHPRATSEVRTKSIPHSTKSQTTPSRPHNPHYGLPPSLTSTATRWTRGTTAQIMVHLIVRPVVLVLVPYLPLTPILQALHRQRCINSPTRLRSPSLTIPTRYRRNTTTNSSRTVTPTSPPLPLSHPFPFLSILRRIGTTSRWDRPTTGIKSMSGDQDRGLSLEDTDRWTMGS
jgi:hypothetical protein